MSEIEAFRELCSLVVPIRRIKEGKHAVKWTRLSCAWRSARMSSGSSSTPWRTTSPTSSAPGATDRLRPPALAPCRPEKDSGLSKRRAEVRPGYARRPAFGRRSTCGTHCVSTPPTRIKPRRMENRLLDKSDPRYALIRTGLQPGHLGNVG
jgi:hypothetical protein